MAPSKLYLAARAYMPISVVDPGAYRVAIFDGPAQEEDSPVWFSCEPDRKLEAIRASYTRQRNSASENKEDVYLIQDGKPITDMDALAEDYDPNGERIIVLEAYVLARMPQYLRASIMAGRVKKDSQDDDPRRTYASMARRLSSSGDADVGGAKQIRSPKSGHTDTSKLRPSNDQVPNNKPLYDPVSFAKSVEGIQKKVRHSTLVSKENAVAACIPLLNKINDIMSSDNDSLVLNDWVQRVVNLCEEYEDHQKPKTVIGLLGQTGAGKSSLVNALLDEEQIVPTSGMQACTAAPTLIAFNDMTASKYRAEIEFVKPSEWEDELQIFMDDIVHFPDESSRRANTDIASTTARVHAAHANLRKNLVTKEDIDRAMSNVYSILGVTKVFQRENSEEFNQKLQEFVFTKDKNSRTENETDSQAVEELWPLVKIVRIYTKSRALATGAILMDLPGLGDSNAARSNVARAHMGQCDFLWILSNIKRAVDDETAKNLLGKSLNTQLIMDGSVNNTTVICTATDDVRVTEFSHLSSLKLLKKEDEEFERTREFVEAAIEALEQQVENHTKLEEKYDEQISALEQRLNNYSTASTALTKRNGCQNEPESAKKRKTTDSGFIFVGDENDHDDDNDCATSTQAKYDTSPESRVRYEQNLSEIKGRKREETRQRTEKRDTLKQKKTELKQLKEAAAKRREDFRSECIKERNKICKGKIRSDYVDCIRSLDEREMQQKDPEGFDPRKQIRDYDALNRNLPVFCTSSIAYQKLHGRYIKDDCAVGFRNDEDTEIPAVRAHCIRLTETARDTACERFLVKFCELASSLKIWAQSCDSVEYISSKASTKRDKLIKSTLDRLNKALKHAALSTSDELRSALDRHIYQEFPQAIEEALKCVAGTTKTWGTLNFNTYKATCRRSGVHKDQDWNQALLDLIMTNIARGWNVLFSSLAPKILERLVKCVKTALAIFQQEIKEALDEMSLSKREDFLQIQVMNHKLALESLSGSTMEALNRSQKEISREFKGLFQKKMMLGYDACVAEVGPGSLRRMQDAMSRYIREVQEEMFSQNCDTITGKLSRVIDKTEKGILQQMQHRMELLRNDYENAVGGFNRDEDKDLREGRHNVAQKVMNVLSAIDRIQLQPEPGKGKK